MFTAAASTRGKGKGEGEGGGACLEALVPSRACGSTWALFSLTSLDACGTVGSHCSIAALGGGGGGGEGYEQARATIICVLIVQLQLALSTTDALVVHHCHLVPVSQYRPAVLSPPALLECPAVLFGL